LKRLRGLLLLITNAACITAAELLLRTGALHSAHPHLLGFNILTSWHAIGGILCYLVGFAAWMFALKSLPLALAFNFTMLQQATVALGAWYFLGESIPLAKWGGIAILILGVFLLVPAIITAEPKAEAPGADRP
jgi:drug/metabolite transporter (DMT)-like permease